jgi:transposase
MTLGKADKQGDLLDDVARFCDETLPQTSIYSFLRRERDRLFCDEEFGDLFTDRGRRSVPPSVIAVVMVLQRLEGLSDREAVDRYCFDNRWRYAAGVGRYDAGGWTGFSHTVLVDMRERLRNSERPDRIFEAALGAAGEAGLIGRTRALDSTPLYDAVATMDTITLIRSAIRGLLKVADDELAHELAGVLTSGDTYASSAKPQIDWDDGEAREALIDSRAQDAYACLSVLDGRVLDPVVTEASELLATVVGQDLDVGADGVFRIARRVAKDRVISTVDPEARHGHKTAARGFDGYKGHAAIDPDSEIITATTVTPGNASDGSVAPDLIGDLLADDNSGDSRGNPEDDESTGGGATDIVVGSDDANSHDGDGDADANDTATVYGDSAYGTGEFQSRLENEGIESKCKTQKPITRIGFFAKDRFIVNLEDDTVTCPAGVTVTIRRHVKGSGLAKFAKACTTCPLRSQCTKSAKGRNIAVGLNEAVLSRARRRQQGPNWVADYRATRPKVERKLGHLMRRKHGGRRARVRGTEKVGADFSLLAAAVNLARLGILGASSTSTGWTVTGA